MGTAREGSLRAPWGLPWGCFPSPSRDRAEAGCVVRTVSGFSPGFHRHPGVSACPWEDVNWLINSKRLRLVFLLPLMFVSKTVILPS